MQFILQQETEIDMTTASKSGMHAHTNLYPREICYKAAATPFNFCLKQLAFHLSMEQIGIPYSIVGISSIPQSSALAFLLFLIFINYLAGVVSSFIPQFTKDCHIYCPISTNTAIFILQDPNNITS